jgi:hypothetical protein
LWDERPPFPRSWRLFLLTTKFYALGNIDYFHPKNDFPANTLYISYFSNQIWAFQCTITAFLKKGANFEIAEYISRGICPYVLIKALYGMTSMDRDVT